MTASLPGLRGGIPELEAHFDRHAIPAPTRELILGILQGAPLRRVGGGARNAVVRYASRKMGVVVQAESRTVEGAFVQQAEFDPHLHLYLCQPLPLTVTIVDSRGRSRTIHTVVDFFALTSEGFFLVECKSPDELRRDSERPHPRFVRDGEHWRWPAAEEAARALGFKFMLFTSEDVNPIYLRNMRFLADYLDVGPPSEREELQSIVDRVKQAGSVRVGDLIASPELASASIWWLVAHCRLWADLERERLFEPDQAWVHDSEARMLAQRHVGASAVAPDTFAAYSGDPESAPVCLEPGARILWQETPWTVLHRGPSSVDLQCADGTSKVVTVPLDDAERLIGDGTWRGDPSPVDDQVAAAREYLVSRASDSDLESANTRYRVVRHYLGSGSFPPGQNPDVGRRYMRWYRAGEKRFRSGYLGLIRPRGRRPGTPNLPEPQAQALGEILEQFANDRRSGRLSAAYSRLKALCKERGLTYVPCEETLGRAFRKLSRPGVERARRGARAAYQLQGPAPAGAPPALRHGDRAYEVGHIDHALLDLPLVSSRTGTLLGKPWFTPLLDAYSRMPLGMCLSFDPPSRASVAAAIYDCVRRHNRATDSIVFDQALEFHATMTESALAYLGVHKIERPARSPRFGSVMERFFRTLETRCIHEMKGNTQLLALGRGLSPSHHPHRTAAWTLPMLHDALERWLFDVYPDLVHSTLGATPREVFEKSVARSGERLARYVHADFSLRILLAQPPPRGDTRKADSVRGIVIDYLRYWHDDFEFGDVAGTDVPVKIDVVDCSVAFAYVRGRWANCRLADGDADLHGRSWRQVRLAVDALRAQRREGRAGRKINAELIGEFLREADEQGEIALQAARDAEAVGLRFTVVDPSPAEPPLRLVSTDGVPTDDARPGPSNSGLPEPGDDSVDPDTGYDDLDGFDVR